MKLAEYRTRMIAIVALLAVSPTLIACSSGGGSDQQPGNAGLVDTGQSESGTPGSARPTAAVGMESSTTGNSAGVKVSPSQVAVGNFTVTVSVGPAVRMFAEPSASGTPAPQGQQEQQGQQNQQSQGSQGQGGTADQEVVLGGQMLNVTKNLDATQAASPDPKDAQGDYIRHVNIQVKDKSTGQIVPYLTVTMDLLRDGRPIRYDQALVPMLPAGGKPDQLHYGNNVAFPGKGRYQLFVRMPASALLGNGSPPFAQFELTIE